MQREAAPHPNVFSGLSTKILQYAPGAIVPAVFGVLNSVIFTRLLRAGEYGRFSLVISIVTTAAAVLTQSLQQGITRFLPTVDNESSASEMKAAVALACGTIVVTTGIVVVIVATGRWMTVDEQWTSLVWPGVGLFLVTAIMGPLSAVLQGEMRAKRHATYSVIGVMLKFALSLALVLGCRREPSSLLIAGVMSQAIIAVPMWRDAGIRFPSLSGLAHSRAVASLGRMLQYGFPMVGYCVAASLLAVGDRYVIQYFRGEAEVGVYAANYSLVSWGLGLVTAPVLLAAHPFFMKAWGMGNRGEAANWLGVITELYLGAGALLVGGLVVFSRDVAWVALGAEFREGHRIMPVVLAGVIAWQVAMYTHKPLEFAGRTRSILVLSLSTAALNVIANVWLVPKYGYVAAAYTTLGCYSVYALWTAVLGQRVLKWTLDWTRLGGHVAVVVAGLSATGLLREWAAAQAGYVPGLLTAVVGSATTSAVVLYRLFRPFAARAITTPIAGA